MSLLNIAIKGDLEAYQKEEIALMRKANLYALQVGSQVLQQRLERQTSATLGAKLGKTWKSKVYINPSSPAAIVYSKAPAIISSFAAETVIVPRNGKHLAVPTGFNRKGGQRGGKVLVTPAQMIASRLSFSLPRKNGPGLIWFLKVAPAQARTRRGRVQDLAMAGALVSVGAIRRRRVRKDEVSASAILASGAVPMFVLLPQVKHSRRIDTEAETKRIADELPGYVEEGYRANDRSAA